MTTVIGVDLSSFQVQSRWRISLNLLEDLMIAVIQLTQKHLRERSISSKFVKNFIVSLSILQERLLDELYKP